MDKVGVVTNVDDHIMKVEVERPGECGEKCNSCAGACSVEYMTIELPNKYDAKIGDVVELNLEPTTFVKYTFVLYTIPLIFFALGITLGFQFYEMIGLMNQELTSVTLGFLSLILGYVVVGRYNNKYKNSEVQDLTIKNVFSSDEIIK